MIEIKKFAEQVSRLLHMERLDNLDHLITTPSWDTHPIFTRYDHISFLDRLSVLERSEVLFAFALRHLERIIDAACAKLDRNARENFLAMISVQGWEDLTEPTPEPPVPSFFICTKVSSLMTRTIVKGARTPQAKTVAGWIERLGESESWTIGQASNVDDLETFSVYVGPNSAACSGLLTLADLCAL